MTELRVVSTVHGPWPQPVELIELWQVGYRRFLWRLLRASKDADIIIMRGTCGFSERYAEAIAATLIKLVRRRPPVIFVEEALFDLSSQSLERILPRRLRPLLPRVARLAVGLADGPHVAYGVISTDEQRSFEALWGIEPRRVFFTPYYATVPPKLENDVTDGGYVFAGGNTLRDYELLASAAAGLEVPVKIASTWEPAAPLPANVEVFFTGPDEYHRRMAAASVIVVPLRSAARSAGQQTYLSAMLIGKPLIVTEAPGVRDYLQPDETAFVVEPDAAKLHDTLRWVLDPTNRPAVERVAEAGRTLVQERHLAADYFREIWDAAVAFRNERRDSKRPA